MSPPGRYLPAELPDVIVVMSESYFDLNRVPGLTLNKGYLQKPETDAAEGHRRQHCGSRLRRRYLRRPSLKCSAAPAMGPRTTPRPALQLRRGWQNLWTFQDYFSSLGYHTNFVHHIKLFLQPGESLYCYGF